MSVLGANTGISSGIKNDTAKVSNLILQEIQQPISQEIPVSFAVSNPVQEVIHSL